MRVMCVCVTLGCAALACQVSSYYSARWNLQLTRLQAAVDSGTPMDFDKYLNDLYDLEWVRATAMHTRLPA